MRSALKLPLATLVLLTTACASPQAPVGDPAAEVRAVWTAQVDAWNRGDLDDFMAGYWKSPDLVFFSNRTETRGWQQTLDRYRASYAAEGRQMGMLDFPQLEFKVLGPEAVLARGRWRVRVLRDGASSTIIPHRKDSSERT